MKEKDFVMLERLVDGKFTITSYRLFYGDDCTMCNNTFERIDFDGILNIIPYRGTHFIPLEMYSITL